jgi:hypothetical protein
VFAFQIAVGVVLTRLDQIWKLNDRPQRSAWKVERWAAIKPAMADRKKSQALRWQAMLIRKRGQILGTIEAPGRASRPASSRRASPS